MVEGTGDQSLSRADGRTGSLACRAGPSRSESPGERLVREAAPSARPVPCAARVSVECRPSDSTMTAPSRGRADALRPGDRRHEDPLRPALPHPGPGYRFGPVQHAACLSVPCGVRVGILSRAWTFSLAASRRRMRVASHAAGIPRSSAAACCPCGPPSATRRPRCAGLSPSRTLRPAIYARIRADGPAPRAYRKTRGSPDR